MATLGEAAAVERSGITGELERVRSLLGQLHDRLRRLNAHISGPKPDTPENKAPKPIARSMEGTLAEAVERISYCQEELAHVEKSIGV